MSGSADTLYASFASPSKAYSPVPIWWWSGERIEPARLRWQLERFVEGGIFNLIVLNLAPTSPLYGSDPDAPPFLTEEWWALFLGMCEDARALGVRIWFYDQIGFSGANFQGQVVRDQPAYAGQWLESLVQEGDGPLALTCPPEGMPLAAAVTALDADGMLSGQPELLPLHARGVRVEGGRHQRLRLVYAVRRGFDYFSPAACANLLDRVHGAFERQAAHLFGDVIVGSFQDELPSLATWGADFAAAFQAQKGYDLTPHLAALWDGTGPAAEQLRVDFHQVRAALAEEAFFKPLFHWHERHGLLCGFDQQGPARGGHPQATVNLYADYLQTHRWYTVPGSDHHGEAKLHSSLAHLYGRPRVWIEAFHSSGWGGTLEETYDWLLPWLRAGANLYDPHAVYYSTRGGWWEWAPPSTCWRQPYWRHYRHFAQAVSRLCSLLSQGDHVCDVGVLFPTVTVQAGLDPGAGAQPQAAAAHDIYQELLGSMFWQAMRPGVLDRDRRDFDVLDDASVQRGTVENGLLCIGAERYRAVVLPSCTVMDSNTAALLDNFVEGGGMLVAIGALPARAVGGAGDAVARLHRHFDEGRARLVAQAEALPAALAGLPRLVDAPVPTLRRRIDGQEVLFVPAAYPYATRQEPDRGWLDVAYTFNPADYPPSMTVTIRGVQHAPELWDPFDGSRRRLAATVHTEGVTVEVPFATGPAALLVWPANTTARDGVAASPGALQQIHLFDEVWEAALEPTLDNRYGDFAWPAHDGAPPVQTWHMQHREERPGEDGLAAGWQLQNGARTDWKQVTVTFATQGWWCGPQAPATLPAPLAGVQPGGDPLAVAAWQPLHYSLSRGIAHDPIHRGTLGPKGHVPEEFLRFGPVAAGQGVQVRTTVFVAEAARLHVALGAAAAKQLWINGQEIEGAPEGYLWLAPVQLQAGLNTVEFRLVAAQNLQLRGYWALVRDVARFARPEWMTAPGAPVRHSQLRFRVPLELPFAPVAATLQVGADTPCRVLVNGDEVGRQGGFDPYHSTARVQPYPVQNLRQGVNQIEVEVQDVGRPAAVVVDGMATGAGGERATWHSGPGWSVQREDDPAGPVQLRRRQWVDPSWDSGVEFMLDLDPSFSHLWRRPHPLPGANWLETAPDLDVVLPLAPDPYAGGRAVAWLAWTLPPGATTMQMPVRGAARLWVDGIEVPVTAGVATLSRPEALGRQAVLRVEPARGDSGGRLLEGPVTYSVASGRITLGLWGEQGLEAYSGGLRYRQRVVVAQPGATRLWLDLGRVRGTAELWVNGRPAGARIGSPYRFDVTELVQPGENLVEVLVLNTLAPYLAVQSPTFYVFPGQTASGMLGPVRLLRE